MRIVSFLLALAIFGVAVAAGFGFIRPGEQGQVAPASGGVKITNDMSLDSVTIAGGCFWCLEPLFEMVPGVTDVEVGYAGGKKAGVDYEQVCMGNTGHAEAVKITFDKNKVSEEQLMELFFTVHNPTTLNAQGPDHGTQYRSTIFYRNDEEKALAEKVIANITKEKIWDAPIVTTVEPLVNYTRAEEYHQDYYKKFENASFTQKMGMNSGYCTAIIEPKVKKFKAKLQKEIAGHK